MFLIGGKRAFFGDLMRQVLRIVTLRALLASVLLVATAGMPKTSVAAERERLNVTFVNPGRSDELFWTSVSAFMAAAAEDLDIDLEVIYAERDRLRMMKEALAVLEADRLPDYLVIVNEAETAHAILPRADSRGVKVFMLLNSFTGEDVVRFGGPREKFKNWVGALIPDNRSAGRAIARAVVGAARQAGAAAPDGKIYLAAIAGDKVTPASVHRDEGLDALLADAGETVVMRQRVYGRWRKDRGRELGLGLLQRYPEVTAIWTANDPMALGVLEAARELGREPGVDVFIGGLNWSADALRAVVKGDMVVSVGGHFMAGGWAMVLLRDYHDGFDFADQGAEVGLEFGVLNAGNAGAYLEKFSDGNWRRIDFRRYSRSYDPTRLGYDFGAESLLAD